MVDMNLHWERSMESAPLRDTNLAIYVMLCDETQTMLLVQMTIGVTVLRVTTPSDFKCIKIIVYCRMYSIQMWLGNNVKC